MRWIPALLLLAPWGRAEPRETKTCDTAAIRWNLPHEFEQAREEAKRKNRLLILKGIAFGMDKKGATCATDGSW